MAKTDEKVMALVEKELKKSPDASVDELYEKAKKAESAIGQLSKRQFNARYPLQVKRRMSRQGSGGKRSRRRSTRKARKKGDDGQRREKVRETLLRFASDLAAAEERRELVDVVAGVDKYVDQVLKAADGS